MSRIELGEIAKSVAHEAAAVCLRKVSVEESLVSSGLIDSVGLIELASALEQKFQISIPFEEMTTDNFDSANHIARYLSDKFSL